MESPEHKVFVGGLSWETTDRALETVFRRFGKVVDAKVMLDRMTGRSRGFGFVTFTDVRGMEDAIAELHNGELDGRIISVTKAQPRFADGGDDGYGGGGGYSSGRRGSGYGGGRGGGGGGGGGGRDECFRCGRTGHWARECPSGGGGGGRFPPRDRYGDGPGYGGGSRSDRYDGGRSDRYGDGYGGGGKYSDRDHGKDSYSGRDRYDDGFSKGSGGRSSNGYGDRDRYGGGGPARYEGGSYRDRSAPYDRPSGRRSTYDDRY